MKEIICINVGQTGIRIGNAFWEQIALEHGIQPDGTRPDTEDNHDISSFFYESKTEKFVPRCISTDLEGDIINQAKTGAYRGLFQSDSFVYGKDGAAVYPRGYEGEESKKVQENLFNRINTMVESCESLEGFMIFRALGGGTGSGLGSAVMKHLIDKYGRKHVINFSVYPSSRFSNSNAEIYNTVLTHQNMIEHSSLNFIFDNEAIYDILERKVKVQNPSYENINRLIAQAASSITASKRFGGTANSSFLEIVRNVVPYPRMLSTIVSYSPFTSEEKLYHEQPSVLSITDSLFDPACTMAKLDYTKSKVVACCVMYQGDALLYDINAAINNIKEQREIKFVGYVPTGIKTSTISEPPVVVPNGDLAQMMRSGIMLMNSGATDNYLSRILRSFDQLYSKRAFTHHFHVKRTYEDEIQEARGDLEALIQDYKEISNDDEEPENYDEGY